MRRFHLFIFLITIFIFLSSSAFAEAIYTIEKGDNLHKISKKFSVAIKEIKTKNNMTSSRIKAGGKIIIPTKKSTPPIKADKKPENQNTDNDALIIMAKEDTNCYTVKKGDTLSAISKKHSVPVSEIKEINNLRSTRLKPGQKLLLKTDSQKTYTVRKGDTFYRIARRFNIDIDELRKINGLETSLLKPGQKLLLKPEEKDKEIKDYGEVASETNIEKETKKVAESEEPDLKGKLVLFAKKLINMPYRFGGTCIFGFDCSGYVQKVYSMIGINLPRSAREQFREGSPIEKEELNIGDLVFFRTYAPFPSHVGIYLGDNLFIHASSEAKKVTIDSLNAPYYLKRFIGAKRIIEENTL